MAGFTDNGGRWWAVVLDADAVGRVRAAAGGVDLAPDGPDGVDRAMAAIGPRTLADILHAACRPDAEARGLTRDQFARAIYGAAADRATTALVTAVIETRPPQLRRQLMDEWGLTVRTVRA